MIMQVLVFILAALIFMLIIGYGYKAISYFLERQQQVMLAEFHTDLRIAVEKVKRQPGTVRKIELNLPSNVQGICFFGSTCGAGAILETPAQDINVRWAIDACKKTGANVFLFPRMGSEEQLDIVVDNPGFVCIPNSGGVTIRLEGAGRTAKVSEWV